MRKTLLLLTLFILVFAWSAWGFSLYEHNIETEKGKIHAFTVKNTYSDDIYVKVSFDTEKIKEIPDGSGDCSRGIRAFPKFFSLHSGETQVVKVLGKTPGYCRMFLLIERQNPEQVKLGDGISLNLRYEVGIPVCVK